MTGGERRWEGLGERRSQPSLLERKGERVEDLPNSWM